MIKKLTHEDLKFKFMSLLDKKKNLDDELRINYNNLVTLLGDTIDYCRQLEIELMVLKKEK